MVRPDGFGPVVPRLSRSTGRGRRLALGALAGIAAVAFGAGTWVSFRSVADSRHRARSPRRSGSPATRPPRPSSPRRSAASAFCPARPAATTSRARRPRRGRCRPWVPLINPLDIDPISSPSATTRSRTPAPESCSTGSGSADAEREGASQCRVISRRRRDGANSYPRISRDVPAPRYQRPAFARSTCGRSGRDAGSRCASDRRGAARPAATSCPGERRGRHCGDVASSDLGLRVGAREYARSYNQRKETGMTFHAGDRVVADPRRPSVAHATGRCARWSARIRGLATASTGTTGTRASTRRRPGRSSLYVRTPRGADARTADPHTKPVPDAADDV